MTHNATTGDKIATGKGSLEKYAQGWENIFKPKKKVEETTWNMADGSTVTFKGDPNGYGDFVSVEDYMYFEVDDSCIEPMMVSYKCMLCRDTVCIYNCSVGKTLSSTVMALDFHDSVAVKAQPVEDPWRDNEDAKQAWEDAWRDAVMRKGEADWYGKLAKEIWSEVGRSPK